MKLSDIKGDQVLDVLAELIVPVTNIAMDEAAAAIFKKAELPEGENRTTFALKRIQKNIPVLIKGHKDDLIKIMAIISQQTEDEYKQGLSMASFIHDLTDLMSDEEFVKLFT